MATVFIDKAVLDDLCSRFLINLPEDERKDPIKLCYHLELAYWFYLDLLRPEDPTLPACTIKEFFTAIFVHHPPLKPEGVSTDALINMFKASKARKPLRGAIIMNKRLDKCLLVQGYFASSTWGFPKGKAEEGENELQSAVRETYEETGFDIQPYVKEEWFIEKTIHEQHYKLYIVPGVSESFKFSPQTRKEIKDIQWFQIASLPQFKKDVVPQQNLGMKPNDFYRIIPFIKSLRNWIENYKRNLKFKVTPTKQGIVTNHSMMFTHPNILSVGVVMTTSVSPPRNAVAPSIVHPSTKPPLLPHSQPLLPLERNQQYAASTVYYHKTPLLAIPPSHKYPLLSHHGQPIITSTQYPHPIVHAQYPHPTGVSSQGSRTLSQTGTSRTSLSNFTFLAPALANFKLDYSQIVTS